MSILTEFLHDNRIEFREHGEHHHTSSGWTQVDCPYCSPKSGQFRLGLTATAANCWVCGRQRLLQTLVDLTGLPAGECRKVIGFDSPVEKKVSKRGRLVIPKEVGFLTRTHIEYLEHRGFVAAKIVAEWEIRGIGPFPGSPLAWRIFIPIHLDGEIVSWTTRKIGYAQPKYISANEEQEVFSSKTLLYGEDYCKHRVLVCEGPTDVWRIGPGAVATMGSNFTTEQVLRISKYPVRYICYDNEPLAQKQARRLCHELEMFEGETHNVVIESKDPGSANRNEVKELRNLLIQ